MSIHFEKPDFESIRKDGLTAVDMHFHTRYSDTYTRIPNILKKAKRLGIGVAITDHNMIKGAAIATSEARGTLIISGVEVSCSEGAHILVYANKLSDLTEFYIKYIKDYTERSPYSTTKLHIEQLLDKAADYNFVVSAAHPYTPNNWGIAKCISKEYVSPRVYEKMHAIEVINGTQSKKNNLKAVHLAHSLNKPFTGGSDGHTLASLGTVVSVGNADTPEDFLERVRKKQNKVFGTSRAILPGIAASVKSFSKHLVFAYPTMRLKMKKFHELSIDKRVKPQIQKGVDIIKDHPVERVAKEARQIRIKAKKKVEKITSKNGS